MGHDDFSPFDQPYDPNANQTLPIRTSFGYDDGRWRQRPEKDSIGDRQPQYPPLWPSGPGGPPPFRDSDFDGPGPGPRRYFDFDGQPDGPRHPDGPGSPFARYMADRASRILKDDPPPPPPSYTNPSTYIAVPIALVAILLVTGFLVVRYVKKRRLRRLNLQKFLSLSEKATNSTTASIETEVTYVKSHAESQMAKIAVRAGNVQLTDNILGRGEYGLVTKGFANGLLGYPDGTPVAVKTLIRPEDRKQRRSFRAEVETMMHLGRNLNIVNLLGTVNLISPEGNPMIILEYCSNGSLKNYLRRQRIEFFYNQVDEEGNLSSCDGHKFDELRKAFGNHQEELKKLGGSSTEQICLCTTDLISFAYQICRGMEYLESNSVIHRDLAARNVLVTEKMIAKISDFGMAKHGPTGEYFVVSDFDTAMPVKWMAPETILQKYFSHKSDVWAFGILLHELFTLGSDPYPNQPVQDQVVLFVEELNSGMRMLRSKLHPADIFNKVTSRCWHQEPLSRPGFAELRTYLECFVPGSLQREYIEMNQEYEVYNETYGISPANAYVDINYSYMKY